MLEICGTLVSCVCVCAHNLGLIIKALLLADAQTRWQTDRLTQGTFQHRPLYRFLLWRDSVPFLFLPADFNPVSPYNGFFPSLFPLHITHCALMCSITIAGTLRELKRQLWLWKSCWPLICFALSINVLMIYSLLPMTCCVYDTSTQRWLTYLHFAKIKAVFID